MVGGSERICADIWEKTLGLMWTDSSRLFDMRRIGVKAGSAANNLALTLVPFWALLGDVVGERVIKGRGSESTCFRIRGGVGDST